MKLQILDKPRACNSIFFDGHTYSSITILFEEVTDMDFEKMQALIAEQLGVDAEKVELESSFIEDLGADSLDLVELIMALEEEYDIEIPDEDSVGLKTVQDAIDYIEKKNSN